MIEKQRVKAKRITSSKNSNTIDWKIEETRVTKSLEIQSDQLTTGIPKDVGHEI